MPRPPRPPAPKFKPTYQVLADFQSNAKDGISLKKGQLVTVSANYKPQKLKALQLLPWLTAQWVGFRSHETWVQSPVVSN